MNSPTTDTVGSDQSVFQLENVAVYYGKHLALREVVMGIPEKQVTAFIGPSGCGKSTLLRCFNRTNDLIPGAAVKGRLTYRGIDLHGEDIDPVAVRRKVGMVFQQPNPFPKTIYDNISFSVRINKPGVNMDEVVETSLRRAALWDEVKDKLKDHGTSLSGGQQQRLCIARAIALKPDVILMDEPCSALDPISTLRIEELITELKQEYTIVIVTHNMQQASRVADYTAFFNAEAVGGGRRVGYLVEMGHTETIFSNPQDQMTLDYVNGRFG